MAEAGIPVTNNWRRISYFHCSLLGYFLGLLTATVSSEVCYIHKFITGVPELSSIFVDVLFAAKNSLFFDFALF